MRMAMGEGQEVALTEAANLIERLQARSGWAMLDGAQISVFEDTPGGVKSLQAARAALGRMDIHIDTRYFGIARKRIKKEALKSNGALVFQSLTEALDFAW
jgi:hypothetical protein